MIGEFTCSTPDETFALGERIGRELAAGDVVLLFGGLGAGKTLLTKGIMNALEFDIDEVTSPSFSLVNLYKTPTVDVYHIDLWRIDPAQDPAGAVGLVEILEHPNAVSIIEWADRLGETLALDRTIAVEIAGDGDDPRKVTVRRSDV